MKISAVVIAKNEEKTISDCLSSMRFANEIILIDDASTDRTVEIAKQYKAKIFHQKMRSYSSQRNYGTSKTSNDWVLMVDADERVSRDLTREISNIKSTPAAAYSIPFKNYLGKKWLRYGGLYPDRHIRLFNKHHAAYKPSNVHENLEIRGQVEELRSPIIHLTYRDTFDYYQKVRKYAALEAKDTNTAPSWAEIAKTFYRKYLKLRGYKDGWAGLTSAKLLTYYQYLVRKEMKRAK